jgi:hypothetical protein
VVAEGRLKVGLAIVATPLTQTKPKTLKYSPFIGGNPFAVSWGYSPTRAVAVPVTTGLSFWLTVVIVKSTRC